LSPAWLRECREESAEFRLATSLASLRGLRRHLEPVAGASEPWFEERPSPDVVWRDGYLPRTLIEILRRRLLDDAPFRLPSRCRASLSDVAAFVDGRVDDALLADFIWALSLVEDVGEPAVRHDEIRPTALYALMKLCFAGHPVFDVDVPLDAEILRLAATGQGLRASEAAIRRLRASGLVPAVRGGFQCSSREAERTAAAVIFPISSASVGELAKRLHIKENAII